jgi:hypothetical protein
MLATNGALQSDGKTVVLEPESQRYVHSLAPIAAPDKPDGTVILGMPCTAPGSDRPGSWPALTGLR